MALSRPLAQLLLLAVGLWIVMYLRFGLGPLQEAFQHDLRLNDQVIAWLQGPAIAAPMAIGAIPIALAMHRLSRATLFLVVIAASVVANVAAAMFPVLPVLIVSRVVIGIAMATALMSGYSMVADLYPPHQRGRATMLVSLGDVLGAPTCFALGGYVLVSVAPTFAHLTDWASWRISLALLCALPLFFFPPLLALREPTRVANSKRPGLGELAAAMWWYKLIIGPLILARIMVWIADGAVFVWAAPAFLRQLSLQPDAVGSMMGAALLTSAVLGPILGGALADICQRLGGSRLTLACLGVVALISAPAASFAIASTPLQGFVLLSIFLTLGYTIGTAALTVGTVVMPAPLRPLYIAITIAIGALFSIGFAPVVVAMVSDSLGGEANIGPALAMVCAASSVVGAAVFLLSIPFFPGYQRAAQTEEAAHA